MGDTGDGLSGTDAETGMRAQFRATLRGVALLGAQLGMGSGLHAQTVSLDNVPPIALTSSSSLSAVDIDVITGNVVVRSAAGGYQQCTQATGPVIDIFTVTPSTTAPGSTVALTWRSQNTSYCVGSQGTVIWASLGQLPVQNLVGQPITIPANTPGNSAITFQLTCYGADSQSASRTTTLSVQTAPTGNCTPIYPNGINSSFLGTFGPWPSYNSRNRIPQVPANGYESWSFVATSVANQFGTVATYAFPGDGDGFGQLSISRTPGCFSAAELGPNCLGPPSRLPQVSWRNGGGVFACALTPGVTYYLNLTYGNTSLSGGSEPYCPGGSGTCGADVQNQQQD